MRALRDGPRGARLFECVDSFPRFGVGVVHQVHGEAVRFEGIKLKKVFVRSGSEFGKRQSLFALGSDGVLPWGLELDSGPK